MQHLRYCVRAWAGAVKTAGRLFPAPVGVVVAVCTAAAGGKSAGAVPARPSQDASRTVTVAYAPSCAACVIDTSLVVTLGRPDDPVLMTEDVRVRRMSTGAYVASGAAEPGLLLRYSASGEFAGTIGRAGSGPGEFQDISTLAVGPGDTVHAFDYRDNVFTPDGRYVRSPTLLFAASAQVYDATVRGDGTVVIQAGIASAQLAGFPFHVASADGQRIRSFGEDAPDRPFIDAFAATRRRVAWVGESALWSADLNRYRLQYWEGGALRRTLVVSAKWFPPWDPASPLGSPRAQRRPPMVRAVGVGRDGMLWVVTTVTAADWKPTPGARGLISPTERGRLMDTIVDVIDPSTGRLIQSRRFDNVFGDFAGPGLITGTVERGDGTIAVRIWQLTVHHPARGE